MTSARVLGICGLVAAALTMAAGYASMPVLLGVSGTVMMIGNLYAMRRG